MAALAHTKVTARLPIGGGRVMQTYRIAAAGTAAADEHIVTGLSRVDACIGYASLGAANLALKTPSVFLNTVGTGTAEGTSPGLLGIEILDEATNDWFFTVIGIE